MTSVKQEIDKWTKAQTGKLYDGVQRNLVVEQGRGPYPAGTLTFPGAGYLRIKSHAQTQGHALTPQEEASIFAQGGDIWSNLARAQQEKEMTGVYGGNWKEKSQKLYQQGLAQQQPRTSYFENYFKGAQPHDDPSNAFVAAHSLLYGRSGKNVPDQELLAEMNQRLAEHGKKAGVTYPTITSIPTDPPEMEQTSAYSKWYENWQAGQRATPTIPETPPVPTSPLRSTDQTLSSLGGAQDTWKSLGDFPKGEDPQTIMKEWMNDPNKRFNKETGQWEERQVTGQQSLTELGQKIEQTLGKIDELKSTKAKEIAAQIDELLPKVKALEAEEAGELTEDTTSIDDEIGDTTEETIITSEEDRESEKSTEEKESEDIKKTLEGKQQEVEDLTLDKQIQDLKTELGIDTDKPVLPTFVDDFEALRSEQGVAGIESQLNTLNAQIRDLDASMRQGMYDVEGELKPMQLIGEEQRELQRQGYEQIDALNRRKQTLVDELNTKNTLITNIMNLKGMDYDAASQAYQQEFSNNISMLNILENRVTRADQVANQKQDDARANLNTIVNMIKDSGKIWSDMDTAMKTEVVKLEMQGGLPVGTFESFMNTKPDAKLLGTKDGVDEQGNDIVSFIYEDADGMPGVVKTKKTGGVSQKDDDTIDDTGLDKWDYFDELLIKNPNASYDELYEEGRRIGMNTGDIKTKLEEAGILDKAGTEKKQEETEGKNEETRKLESKIEEYKKAWAKDGDKGAGTREDFAGEISESTDFLSLQEIKDKVYELVTDEWLEEQKKKGGFWSKLGGALTGMSD